MTSTNTAKPTKRWVQLLSLWLCFVLVLLPIVSTASPILSPQPVPEQHAHHAMTHHHHVGHDCCDPKKPVAPEPCDHCADGIGDLCPCFDAGNNLTGAIASLPLLKLPKSARTLYPVYSHTDLPCSIEHLDRPPIKHA